MGGAAPVPAATAASPRAGGAQLRVRVRACVRECEPAGEWPPPHAAPGAQPALKRCRHCEESGHRLDSGNSNLFWRIQLDQDLFDTIIAIYPEWFKDYQLQLQQQQQQQSASGQGDAAPSMAEAEGPGCGSADAPPA
ncbi:uncharacterized protein LOC124789127, partial [Schistocerca piceifrons]|uniref:uncharacterized protein LOC124789127 n=1 Tax=Schistocerca piceifrons TaxID=274613 RepID=UPI001F5FB88F